MVPSGPASAPGSAFGSLYGVSHGRASVLFVLLAAISCTLWRAVLPRAPWRPPWPHPGGPPNRSPDGPVYPEEPERRERDHPATVVADAEGNAASATQTLGDIFASKVMPEGTGIWLNNSLTYSRFEPVGNPLGVYAGRYRLVGISPTVTCATAACGSR